MSFLVIDPYKERITSGIIAPERYLDKENLNTMHSPKDNNAVRVAIDGIK